MAFTCLGTNDYSPPSEEKEDDVYQDLIDEILRIASTPYMSQGHATYRLM